MKYPVTQLASKGRELAEIADRINSISESAISIAAAISGCYEQGGVDGRATKVSANISTQASTISYLGAIASNAAKVYMNAEDNIVTLVSGRTDKTSLEKNSNVSLIEYSAAVSDAELVKISSLANRAEHFQNPEKGFYNLLQMELPENDPLRKIKPDQVKYYNNNDTGFGAFVIEDGDSAIVVFPGTDWETNDTWNNLLYIGFGVQSGQVDNANTLIDQLEKKYSNIMVTGHSLGGYLATKVTLSHNSIDKCVVFDPPQDHLDWKYLFGVPLTEHEKNNSAKIRTYINEYSIVSGVAQRQYGEIILIDIGNEDIIHHESELMYKTLGGRECVENTWDANLK